ncbi:hypothetical protein BDQ12DRAFT_745588, partial [Crucibulum laeve]
KNASEHTLLPGTASVYIDGSFISSSHVPSVILDESFDCPLWYYPSPIPISNDDPSVRLAYHLRIKKVSQSGFYTKPMSSHNGSRCSTPQSTTLRLLIRSPFLRV